MELQRRIYVCRPEKRGPVFCYHLKLAIERIARLIWLETIIIILKHIATMWTVSRVDISLKKQKNNECMNRSENERKKQSVVIALPSLYRSSNQYPFQSGCVIDSEVCMHLMHVLI